MNDISLKSDRRRYISLYYLRAKVREKGWVYVLQRVMREAVLLPVKFLRIVFVVVPIEVCIFFFTPVFYSSNIRFTNFPFYAIGHLGHDPDCFVKEGILGLRPQFHAVWLTYHKNFKIANPHMLDYWKKRIQKMTVIGSPLICFFLWPFARKGKLTYDVGKYSSSSNRHAVGSDIFKEWGTRDPVLNLSEYDSNRGWESLYELGIPDKAWFVTVHCRESSYDQSLKDYGRKNFDGSKSNMNADINSYIPAMKTIIDNGGWILRVGDSGMMKLPQMDKVIDYAHSGIKTDWMDVFLMAESKFHLGHSGVYGISMAFGVPCAMTNEAQIGCVTFGPAINIGITKLIYSIVEDRLLTFREIFNRGIANFQYNSSFDQVGVKVVDNSPDVIKELTLEMIFKLKGEIIYSNKDNKLQEKFKSLMKPQNYGYGGPVRIGRHFLRKYEYLLE